MAAIKAEVRRRRSERKAAARRTKIQATLAPLVAALQTHFQQKRDRAQVARQLLLDRRRLAVDRNHQIRHASPQAPLAIGVAAPAPHAPQRRARSADTHVYPRPCRKRGGPGQARLRLRVRFDDPIVTLRYFDQQDQPAAMGESLCADTGASRTLHRASTARRLGLPHLGPSAVHVQMADGAIKSAQHKTTIPFAAPPAACAGEVLADCDLSDNLMGLKGFADTNHTVVFHPGEEGVTVHRSEDVNIVYRAPPVVTGYRDRQGSRMWRIPYRQTGGRQSGYAYAATVLAEDDLQRRTDELASLDKLGGVEHARQVYDLPSIEQAISWLHASLGYPTMATWLAACRAGNLVGFPFADVKYIRKYFPETTETNAGHMNMQRQGVRSTRPRPQPFTLIDASDLRGKKERDVYIKVYEAKETLYSDQTGRFPHTSSSGSKYVMLMVEIDSNAVLVEPLSSRKDAELTRAYKVLLNRVKAAGVRPRKHVLDNEVSEAMKAVIRDECKLELVPPYCHRRNIAEVQIKNFKGHFISVLAGVDPAFPIKLWDKLLPGAELQFNLLRQSNMTPTISAHAHLFGPFDFNRTPIAPLGCACDIHVPVAVRASWGSHARKGWYIGGSDDHYRTHRLVARDTQRDCLSQTVGFKHKSIVAPAKSVGDQVVQALNSFSAAMTRMARARGNVDVSEDMRQLSALAEAARPIAIRHGHVASLPAMDEPVDAPRVDVAPRVRSVPPVATGVPFVPRVHNRIQLQPSVSGGSAPRVGPAAVPPPGAGVTSGVARGPAPIKKEESPARTSRTVSAEATSPSRPASPPQQRKVPRELTRLRADEYKERSRTITLGRTSDGRSRRIAARQARQRDVDEALAATLLSEHDFDTRADAKKRFLDKLRIAANAVLDTDSGKMLKYRELLRHPKLGDDWQVSSANEFGRLFQGIGNRIDKPTNTCFFIHKHEVPADRFKEVTYGKFVCVVRPQKAEPNRCRLVLGGNTIKYPYDVSTPTADMLLFKILLNSVVSTPGAKFMTIDISNFYLNTPMDRYEYVKLHRRDIPDEVFNQYKLHEKMTDDGHVYVEVRKGMYGLPQAGILAQELLEQRLAKHGYRQDKIVPGLWQHDWRPIRFSLVVDDFGVEYVGEEHAQHLIDVLRADYKITEDWEGGKYIGIDLEWDYDKRQVHLSMPDYVIKALEELGYTFPGKRQDSPHPHVAPNYGAKQQFASGPDSSAPLDKDGIRFIQQVIGKFLYLARGVDSTIFVALSSLSSQQAKPTETTMKRARQLLDYLATQEEAILTYSASDMILAVHSDAGYLNEDNARSRAGGHFFLSSNTVHPPNNGAILTVAKIIKNVMSSAAEAELGALYIMAREAVWIRIILERMGYKQPPTPIQTDNATAEGVINHKVQPKQTKAMDMRFHWLRDRELQKQLRFFWRPGTLNHADYFTKHHPAAHHRNVRSEFLTPADRIKFLRLARLTRQKIQASTN
ncbi:hypothetical protein THAOC_26721 [Thalassiosira oceanica]|uniref:Integrase catalytic domain-containing protein n=1 Tax=Thalassiosira oceanica TaxID=159749 RepID=K0S4F8_THAOC|nr:hypothetical protein THAOC_26721 [Thalassiosira oceanica]|eukprot:EJK53767.1 hypothetical protein THAOC_26721 [Thalassiosira oceanica]